MTGGSTQHEQPYFGNLEYVTRIPIPIANVERKKKHETSRVHEVSWHWLSKYSSSAVKPLIKA